MRVLLAAPPGAPFDGVRAALTEAGHEVLFHADGLSAAAADTPAEPLDPTPAAALVHWALPGLDAPGLCEHWRERHPRLPLLITLEPSQQEAFRAWRAGLSGEGPVACLLWPFRPEWALTALLDRCGPEPVPPEWPPLPWASAWRSAVDAEQATRVGLDFKAAGPERQALWQALSTALRCWRDGAHTPSLVAAAESLCAVVADSQVPLWDEPLQAWRWAHQQAVRSQVQGAAADRLARWLEAGLPPAEEAAVAAALSALPLEVSHTLWSVEQARWSNPPSRPAARWLAAWARGRFDGPRAWRDWPEVPTGGLSPDATVMVQEVCAWMQGAEDTLGALRAAPSPPDTGWEWAQRAFDSVRATTQAAGLRALAARASEGAQAARQHQVQDLDRALDGVYAELMELLGEPSEPPARSAPAVQPAAAEPATQTAPGGAPRPPLPVGSAVRDRVLQQLDQAWQRARQRHPDLPALQGPVPLTTDAPPEALPPLSWGWQSAVDEATLAPWASAAAAVLQAWGVACVPPREEAPARWHWPAHLNRPPVFTLQACGRTVAVLEAWVQERWCWDEPALQAALTVGVQHTAWGRAPVALLSALWRQPPRWSGRRHTALLLVWGAQRLVLVGDTDDGASAPSQAVQRLNVPFAGWPELPAAQGEAVLGPGVELLIDPWALQARHGAAARVLTRASLPKPGP